MSRGYFGIGIYHGKTGHNIGTLWRSAYILGADFIFTIGKRYKKQASDVLSTWRHIPLLGYSSFEDFKAHIPYDCQIIVIEKDSSAVLLHEFQHPQRAIYLLGAEDSGIPKELIFKYKTISIPSYRPFSFNVATAGTLVLYDRYIKNGNQEREAK